MSYEEMSLDKLYQELERVRDDISAPGTVNMDRDYLRQCEADLVELIDEKGTE